MTHTPMLQADGFRKLAASLAIFTVVAFSLPPQAFAENLSSTISTETSVQTGSDQSITAQTDAQTQTDTQDLPHDIVDTVIHSLFAPHTSPLPEGDGSTMSTTTATSTGDGTIEINPLNTCDPKTGHNCPPAPNASSTTELPPVQQCVLTSDAMTTVNGAASVAVSPLHPSWTAVIPSAVWIWGENPVADPVHGATETFTKTFNLSALPLTANLYIAADNSYSVSVNGTPMAADVTEMNYTAAGQDHLFIPVAFLHVGTNTITFTVHNFPQDGGTMATNPGGLLYRIEFGGASCLPVPPPPPPAENHPLSIFASKVVCTDPTDLPHWGAGGHGPITATTATAWVASHPGCHLQSGWQFEWGFANAGDAGDAFVGPAGNGYTTFGPTNAAGVASTTVLLPSNAATELHLREVLQDGFLPFTFHTHPDNSATTSAEFYCADDALNYDNWDFIRNAQPGSSYFCAAFNAPKPSSDNGGGNNGGGGNGGGGNNGGGNNGGGGNGGGNGGNTGGGSNGGGSGGTDTRGVSGGNSGGSGGSSGGQVLGAFTSTPSQGKVLGNSCGPILYTYLRQHKQNVFSQVKVLQNFLNGELSLALPVSGFFGPRTEQAVNDFQLKYSDDVLAPWVPHGLPSAKTPTGYVYKTTQRKINLIACPDLDLPMPKLP